jgi:hypothetical protein
LLLVSNHGAWASANGQKPTSKLTYDSDTNVNHRYNLLALTPSHPLVIG